MKLNEKYMSAYTLRSEFKIFLNLRCVALLCVDYTLWNGTILSLEINKVRV